MKEAYFTNKDGELENNYNFQNFSQVVSFINKVAVIADNYNHHPNLFIHSYKKLRVTLISHEEGKITEKDYKIGEIITELYKKFTN